ncbi:DUF6204 family protein [Nonomuraea sp. NPDC050536]|uniref:DUF6204 family protein n=1 Tax=Nonomuraea sp. NPDC050536 TaxID=3364366 RepID=UPI0037CC5684
MIVSGAFESMPEADREAVLAAVGAGFTEEGTFTHDGTLSSFTFRCQVEGEDENEAAGRAIVALDKYGVPYRVLRTAVTDMRDIKIRRKKKG